MHRPSATDILQPNQSYYSLVIGVAKRARAIVQAVTNYTDAKGLAELSTDLGEAMVGINEDEIALLLAERGK